MSWVSKFLSGCFIEIVTTINWLSVERKDKHWLKHLSPLSNICIQQVQLQIVFPLHSNFDFSETAVWSEKNAFSLLFTFIPPASPSPFIPLVRWYQTPASSGILSFFHTTLPTCCIYHQPLHLPHNPIHFCSFWQIKSAQSEGSLLLRVTSKGRSGFHLPFWVWCKKPQHCWTALTWTLFRMVSTWKLSWKKTYLSI